MHAALLSPGPSLALYPGRTGFDVVIAVNRAIHREPSAEWWSIGDDATFAENPVDPTPRIWTHGETLRRLRRGPRAPRLAATRAETYDRDERLGWPLFSATAALMLAAKLGASHVTCYGCDMGGEADWDGVRLDRNRRDESRWATERRIWRQTVEELAGRGVEVARVTAMAGNHTGPQQRERSSQR